MDFFNDAPDPIMIFNLEWKILNYNGVCIEKLGYKKDELKDSTLFKITNKSSWELLNNFMVNSQPNETFIFEIVLKSTNGTLTPINLSCRFTENKQIVAVFHSTSTPHSRADQQHENENFNKRLVDHFPAAILIQNMNHEIVYANPKTLSLAGLSRLDEAMGRSIFEFVDPDKAGLIKSRIDTTIQTGESAPFIELEIIHVDGTNRHVESTLIPFKYNNEQAILSVMNDVSSTKLLAKKLKENETKLNQIIDLVPHHIFAKNSQGEILLANKSFADYYNTSTDFIANNKSLPKKTGPSEELEKEFLRIDEKVIKSQKSIQTPIEKSVNGDGAVRYIQTTKVPFKLENETGIEILGISTDVTERIRYEEEIKKNEIRQRAFLNAIPDLIFINSTDGIFIDFHANEEKLITKPEKFLGKNIRDLFDEEISEKILEAFRKATQDEPQMIKYDFVFGKNTEHFEARIIKYNNDQVLSMVRDITKQVNSETALKESQKDLDFYFSKSLDGFYIMESQEPFIWDDTIDKEKEIKRVFDKVRIVKINDSMLNQYGAKDMIGYTLNDFFSHNIHNGHEVVKDLLDKGKQRSITEERRLDGSTFWVEGDYVCQYDKDGAVRGMFGFQRDITDRLASERDIKNMTTDLIKTNNDLQQFAYLTSHDLRAPVINLTSLLSFYNKADPLDPDNSIIMSKVEDSVHQLKSTLDDLVNIVAVKKQSVVSDKNLQIEKVIDEVRKSILQQITETNAKIDTDLKIKSIEYSKTHLYSILQNLLTNAIKYRRDGIPLKIQISTYVEEGCICLEIKDNGMGIDLEKHGNKLFGIYQKFHDVPNSKGLGLYIVKSQVEALGGHITVISTVNQGTTFKAFLKHN